MYHYGDCKVRGKINEQMRKQRHKRMMTLTAPLWVSFYAQVTQRLGFNTCTVYVRQSPGNMRSQIRDPLIKYFNPKGYLLGDS